MRFSLSTLVICIMATAAVADDVNFGLMSSEKSRLQQESTYKAAEAEETVLNMPDTEFTSGCAIWHDESPFRDILWGWRKELEHYSEAFKAKKEVSPDVRRLFDVNHSNREEVCMEHADVKPLEQYSNTMVEQSILTPPALRGRELPEAVHPTIPNDKHNLMEQFFPSTRQLSYLPDTGFMEPLLPPLRHPDMCDGGPPNLGNLDYQIVDHGHICRNAVHKHSRTVFIDMGATYNFEDDTINRNSPALRVIESYRKYGIHFDHIYAYEAMQWDVERVYKTIPKHMQQSLHWINMPVSGIDGDDKNPFTMLKNQFEKDDFVVVKLDIDTPSVERPLFQQMLKDPKLHELVDVFYFEHHVKLDELQPFWGTHDSGLTEGTIHESLDLFHWLRSAGVAAHYWI